MKKVVMFLFFVLFFNLNFISSDFMVGNNSYSINTQYGPAKSIQGWINISLDKEPADSLFIDSFGNSVNLMDLLKQNIGIEYSCDTVNCDDNYIASTPAVAKNFQLNTGDSKLVGLKINGNILSVDSVSFLIDSDAKESCFNQLRLDFGEDNIIETGNTHASSAACNTLKSYGCFDGSEATNEYIIGKFPNKQCQKINLSASPGFYLGAWVDRGSDSRPLKMALYDLSGDEVDGAICTLPNPTIGESKCSINFSLTKPTPYYVCIYSDIEGDSKIKGYSTPSGCGFYGAGIQDSVAAFDIFAQGREFKEVGQLNISNSLSNGNTLAGEVNDYLNKKYNGLNCTNGCVIPIKILSAVNQNINFNNLKFVYETNLGNVVDNHFYDITKTPAKISANYQKIFLDNAGFKVPRAYGNYSFFLKFNKNPLFFENISIVKIPIIKYLFPLNTSSAFPTTFKVLVDKEENTNITEYKWFFGDNQTATTNIDRVVHVYNSNGKYNFRIAVIDSKGRKSSSNFTVFVSSPKYLIKSILNKLQSNIIKLNSKIKTFPNFYQQNLNSILNLEDMNDKFKQIQREYERASTDEEYNKILKELLSLNIPETIYISKKSPPLVFYPKEDKINLDILKEVGGGDYDPDKKQEYTNAVLMWNQKNMDTKIEFSEITADYEDYTIPIFSVFKVHLSQKRELSQDPYFFIKQIQNLSFKEDYLEKEQSGYAVIELRRPNQTIEFSTTSKIDFLELPIFIAPQISRLELFTSPTPEQKKSNKKEIITAVIILIIVGFLAYIFLQEWYKRKYERYLFKNRNDLYNLILYTKNAKDKGLSNKEILNKLKNKGWSNEQGDYVIRKYLGKRTGMIEIPIVKFVEKGLAFFTKRKKKGTDNKTNLLGTGQNNLRKI